MSKDDLDDDEWFTRHYPDAVKRGDWRDIALLLSGRLRQMDKRAKAANARADKLEAEARNRFAPPNVSTPSVSPKPENTQ